MVDKNELCELAAKRHRCWVIGDTKTATDLTKRLEHDWAEWRGEFSRLHVATVTDRPKGRFIPTVEHTVELFIHQRCVRWPGATTPVRDMYDAYTDWATNEGAEQITSMRLTQALKRSGIETSRTKSQRLYRGISLRVTAMAKSPLQNAA